MRPFVHRLTSVGLSLAMLAPVLIAAGCARQANDRVKVAVATLSSSGVAVYETYESRAPIQTVAGVRSAMKVTRWQLTNMVNQADAGMGMLGSDLDRFAATAAPKDMPPFSYFIAAWLKNGGSPLATYAQRLMGTQTDYKHASKMTFPLLVMTLFVADIARMPAAKRTASLEDDTGWEAWIAQPAAAAGICSTVTSFFESTVESVENAIKVSNPSTLGKIWNTVVDLVVGGIEFIVRKALAPFLSVIYGIIGGLVLITTVASSLQPWTVEMEENPESVYLDEKSIEGKITAILHAPSVPWPSDLTDCAQALGGVDLTTINSKNAPVTWNTFGMFPDVASVTGKAPKIDDKNRAELSYSTNPWDTSNKQCATYRNVGYLGAHAYVERQDVAHLEEQLYKLIAAQLPSVIRGPIMQVIQPWLNAANQSFNNILKSQVMGTGTTQVWELQSDPTKCTAPPKPSPPAQPSPNPSASGNGDNTALLGTWACQVQAVVSNKELGNFNVSINTTLTFNKDGTGTGMAFEGSTLSGHNVYNGPGTGAAHKGSGMYTYAPEGPSAGTLQANGTTYHLKWSGANAWSAPMTSPVSHRTYILHCSRQ